MDAQPALTVIMPVSNATSWAGRAARPFRGSRRSRGVLFLPGLDVPGQQQLLSAAEFRGAESAEHALVAAVDQDVAGKHVLPDPDRAKHDLLGFARLPPSKGY